MKDTTEDHVLIGFTQTEIDQLLMMMNEAIFSEEKVEPIHSKLAAVGKPDKEHVTAVLTQTDIDQLTMLIEESMVNWNGLKPTYSRLMEIDYPDDSPFRIK